MGEMERFWKAAKEIAGDLDIFMDIAMFSEGDEEVFLTVDYETTKMWSTKRYGGDKRFEHCLMELKLWMFNRGENNE